MLQRHNVGCREGSWTMTLLWSIAGAWVAASIIATPILARFLRPHPACRDVEGCPGDAVCQAPAVEADARVTADRTDSVVRPNTVRHAPERATSQ